MKKVSERITKIILMFTLLCCCAKPQKPENISNMDQLYDILSDNKKAIIILS